jgi:uncharacterized iron-regulated membrane protein
MRFRKIIFWVHLTAGLVAGTAIGIMCFTGTALAFEKEIVAWAERDVRRVVAPAPPAARRPLDELLQRVQDAQPGARLASIAVSSDPRAAVAFAVGRDGGSYVNPYTGEIRPAGRVKKTRAFMAAMTAWHRTLALTGGNRNLGKYFNGACNIAFCVLAVSGLYLWWPRSWSRRTAKAILLFDFKLRGKARDFNWHNVIGLWSAPVLIVLTATAFPISYQWGGAFINFVTGTPNPPPSAGRGGAGPADPAVAVPMLPKGAGPPGYEALFASVQRALPRWELITLRLANAGPSSRADLTASAIGVSRAPAAPVSFTVRESGSWPRTASTTLTLDPYTGAILRREGFTDQTLGRQVRSWTRFLHTGEALGPVGQLVAGLACLGGCFLVYTGFALSWRRFFGRRR